MKGTHIDMGPIRQLMLKHMVTVEKLAHFTGISAKDIKCWLRGGLAITSGDIRKIAEYFNVHADDLEMRVFAGRNFKTCEFYDSQNCDCIALKHTYCMHEACHFWRYKGGS